MKPTPEQLRQYERDGYYIQRGLVDTATIDRIRNLIWSFLENPDSEVARHLDKEKAARDDPDMGPMGAGRFRKIGQMGYKVPGMWKNFYVAPQVLEAVQAFLGDDLLVKFTSVFCKLAKTGGATPWHQDIGLWRDTDHDAFSIWMAIDPARKENGCLQFVPGSHRTPVVTHIRYDDGVHAELPREAVHNVERDGMVAHIELEPGDAVLWQSHLWHYSPPNRSEMNRIGMAGVWTRTADALKGKTNVKQFRWAMKQGVVQDQFPPEDYFIDQTAAG